MLIRVASVFRVARPRLRLACTLRDGHAQADTFPRVEADLVIEADARLALPEAGQVVIVAAASAAAYGEGADMAEVALLVGGVGAMGG